MSMATAPQPSQRNCRDDHPAGRGLPGRGGDRDGLLLRLRRRRRGAVDVEMCGDLDLASAQRFRETIDWLRQRWNQIIVLDTRQLAFVDLAGYRAFQESLQDRRGDRDPRVLYLPGTTLNRLRRHLARITGQGPPRLS